MIAPEFSITANDRRLALHFAELPDALAKRLRARITSLSARLLVMVHAAEPQRTGRLRSLTKAFMRETPTSIRGGVHIEGDRVGGHNIAAAALEYGQHRVVNVRAHSARLTRVFGHPITPETIAIRAHRRRPNIAAKRFLRDPAAQIRPIALAEMQAAVSEAVADIQKELNHV